MEPESADHHLAMMAAVAAAQSARRVANLRTAVAYTVRLWHRRADRGHRCARRRAETNSTQGGRA
jgi:hypothetical protein